MGAPRPTENHSINSSAGLCGRGYNRQVRSEFFQRIPPASSLDCPSGLPLAVSLSCGEPASVYAGLIRRAVPSGCHVPQDTGVAFNPATLVRMLLFALSDGRIMPDIEKDNVKAAAVPGDTAPIELGLVVLAYLEAKGQKDWCNLHELYHVFRANGIAVPDSECGQHTTTQSRITVDLARVAGLGGQATVCLMQSALEEVDRTTWKCPAFENDGVSIQDQMTHSNTDYKLQRWMGAGPRMAMYHGMARMGMDTRYSVIVDRTYAHQPVSVGVYGMKTMASKTFGDRGVFTKTLRDNVRECQTFISIDEIFPVPRDAVTVEDVVPVQLVPPHVSTHYELLKPLVSWYPRTIVTVQLEGVEVSSAKLIAPRLLYLNSNVGGKVLCLPQDAAQVIEVAHKQVVAICLCWSSVAPLDICVPNCLSPSRAHPDMLGTMLNVLDAGHPSCARFFADVPYVPRAALANASAGEFRSAMVHHVPSITARLTWSAGTQTLRRKDIDWALKQLDPKSTARQVLEVEDEIGTIISVINSHGKGFNPIELVHKGKAVGLLVLKVRPFSVPGCGVALAGVAFCPPLWQEGVDAGAVDVAVRWLASQLRQAHGSKGSSMELTHPSVAESISVLHHAALSGYPYIAQAITTGTLIPKGVLPDSTMRSLSCHPTPIAIVRRPVRNSVFFGTRAKIDSRDTINPYGDPTTVPEEQGGRVGNNILVLTLRGISDCLMMWSAYTLEERLDVAAADAEVFGVGRERTRPAVVEPLSRYDWYEEKEEEKEGEKET
ncbi:hypothetical protein KIPB_008503 [Kipferlia bialata]|uniref:Uncharacterized protein n=1 Tax=Kipferlia bialata TaxID=797122 RepID=A0A9K3D2Y2_9EUKA|nr:hypothetical protein KIPB_008503 [Kipferlia bialata]|eukprot:g8503.t1